jgi:hypothetical protein
MKCNTDVAPQRSGGRNEEKSPNEVEKKQSKGTSF